MSILSSIKTRLMARHQVSPMGLSDFIANDLHNHSYWMRPNSLTQSKQMVGAYLQAMKDDLPNGGYIFVKKSRAPDLFRQLAELDVHYSAVHFRDMTEIHEIICLENPKSLWVIVEDDNFYYDTLASRFKVAEVALRHNIAPPLGTSVKVNPWQELTDKRVGSKRVILMFIEMDYPSIKGFCVVQHQAKSLRISSCRVSLDTTHDHEVNKIFGMPEHSEEELCARQANTICVYGSGLNNFAEMKKRSGHWKAVMRKEDFERSDFTFTDTNIDIEVFANESNHCLAFGFDKATTVDISK